MRRQRFILISMIAAISASGTVHAQEGIDLRQAVGAAILSDMARDRQAERDAKRWPYMSAEHGTISSAEEARDACVREIVAEAGQGAVITDVPTSRSMSTGWEVEGHVTSGDVNGAVPFVCSVRNGLVSGTLIRH